MIESRLVLGLAAEEHDSALRQALFWDEMTVGTGLQRALLRRWRHSGYAQSLQSMIDRALADPTPWTRDFRRPLDPQAMKLCRLLDHLDMPIAAPPDPGTLHVDGLKIEDRTIAAVRRAQRKHDARANNEEPGTAPVERIDDLVRHVLHRLFPDLVARLSQAPPNERERIARQIAEALDRMDDDLREQMRRLAELDERSVQILTRGGALAAGAAVMCAIGAAGFAAYTTLNATIAAISGLVGLTLPISVYITATSLLAFATNPIVLSAGVAGGGATLVMPANRRLRGELLPQLVAIAASKAEPTAKARSRVRAMAGHLADRYQEYQGSDPARRAQLRRAFPAFRAPKENYRA